MQGSSVIVYSAVIAVVCVVVARWLRGHRHLGDLVAAEATGWGLATLLSLTILAGFTVVALLPAGDVKDAAARYVDPVLVIVVSAGYAFGQVSEKLMSDASSALGVVMLVAFLGLSWILSKKLERVVERS